MCMPVFLNKKLVKTNRCNKMIFFLSEKEEEEEKGGGAIEVGVSTCSQFGIFAAGKRLVNQHRVLKCSHRFHPQTGKRPLT